METAHPAKRRSEAAAAGGPSPLMSVRGLGIRFKTAQGVWQATRKIDFDMAPGERVGIVGESGCGKTITGLSILRLLPNNLAGLDGSIMFDGIDLASCSTRTMRGIRGRRIAMIFQEPMSALDPVFTVGHQIAETLRVHTDVSKEEARAQTIEMLRRVGIASPERRIDEYPHQLSGGMRQRVMIAAALICGPQLLIADEPTTALDVTVQAQILELLRNLSETSKTALMLITHDLGVVAETCTRMITMYAGEVIEDAAVDAALVRPLHPYTSGLLRSLPHLSPRLGKLPSIPGRVPSIAEMPRGCRFKARCPHAIAGCEAEQELLDAGEGRKVRCWRFRELELPGALQHAASAPIAGRVVQAMMSQAGEAKADPIVSVRDLEVRLSDDGPPRDGEGGRWRQFRRPPRRDVRNHRRVRIGQDHHRPGAGVSPEADGGRHSAQWPRSAGAAAAGSSRATAATTRSSFRIRMRR